MVTISDPDAELVLKAKQNDKAAFGKLVTHYYEMVYALSYGVLNQREAALDVTQEVFLKVYRVIGTFEGKSKFKTWLHRIAVNAAIDEARKRKPVESLDVREDEEDSNRAPVVIPDLSADPRGRAEQAEYRELLDRAMSRLSAEHKAILVMREWQGFSYEEIAQTLDLELGTVMSRIFYARKKLAEALGQDFRKEVT
jgi:RNA polymerase sigma-70 factor (ECF subfamily)